MWQWEEEWNSPIGSNTALDLVGVVDVWVEPKALPSVRSWVGVSGWVISE